ncbi:hypothetical protein B0H21DRAFT_700940 [Amylocystis lapponica]|nr:hypothetical protein B0H21DRAFT_700940 [Amylocystis lapponica]
MPISRSAKVPVPPEAFPRCPGLKLDIPDGTTPHSVYPTALHDKLSLPWDILISRSGLFAISHRCSQVFDPDLPLFRNQAICMHCRALYDHDLLMGIRSRMFTGCHENTSLAYLSFSQISDIVHRKVAETNKLKLTGLNLGRSLVTKTAAMNNANRIIMAISQGKIPRVHIVLSVARRNGAGLSGILDKLQLASVRVYQPRSYDEADFHRMALFSKLGGARLARIAQHSCNLPSIRTTNRRLNIHPLTPSPGYPTADEMFANMTASFPRDDVAEATRIGPRREVPMSMFVDELKLEERLRWDPSRNKILGVCREHGHQVSLDFRSMAEADVLLDALTHEDPAKQVHLATEATVVAVRVLSKETRQNQARPIVISGTCKHEAVAAQQSLLENTIGSFNTYEGKTPEHRRLYCIGSDGDGKRRRAVAAFTLNRMLSPSNSPIFHLLVSLKLFNLACGADDLTADIDYRHLLKRFRNSILRLKGVTLDDVVLTTSVLRRHLEDCGFSPQRIRSMLSPNDKQNVPLTYSLLSAIASLPPAPPHDSPAHASSRRVLRVLGAVYHHLLACFTNTWSSLASQLAHLSATAHLLLALYSRYKGGFIPVQLYFDTITMIKNVFFCVAKTQVANPDSDFWVILLGTDSLESLFGTVRTMIGNDTNADQLQLASRLGSASLCATLLEEHPDWDRGSRRLGLRRSSVEEIRTTGEVSRLYDHISVGMWSGDVNVSRVSLLTCWKQGRVEAESALREGGLHIPFDDMDNVAGLDVLCPFGENKFVLIGGLMSGEREEDEDEVDSPSSSPDPTMPVLASGAPTDEELEPDLEDMAGTTSESAFSTSGGRDTSPVHEPWVFIGETSTAGGKRQHKASVLRLYSYPLAAKNSKDRLKRIRGYSTFDEPRESQLTFDPTEDNHILTSEDPVVTLLRCNSHVFVAAGLVIDIRVSGASVSTIPIDILREPNVRVRAQIMRITPLPPVDQTAGTTEDVSVGTSSPDWIWTGGFEHLPGPTPSREFEGRWLEPLNPGILQSPRNGQEGTLTYTFDTSTLRATAALLYERIGAARELERLYNVPSSSTFPYRTADGEPSNLLDHDDNVMIHDCSLDR